MPRPQKTVAFYRAAEIFEDGATRSLDGDIAWDDLLDNLAEMQGPTTARAWGSPPQWIDHEVVSHGGFKALMLTKEMSEYPHKKDTGMPGTHYDPNTDGQLRMASYAMFFPGNIVGVLAPKNGPSYLRFPWFMQQHLEIDGVREWTLRVLLSGQADRRLQRIDQLWSVEIALEAGFRPVDGEGGLHGAINAAHQAGARRGAVIRMKLSKSAEAAEEAERLRAETLEVMEQSSDQMGKVHLTYRDAQTARRGEVDLISEKLTTKKNVDFIGEDVRVVTTASAIQAIIDGHSELSEEFEDAVSH